MHCIIEEIVYYNNVFFSKKILHRQCRDDCYIPSETDKYMTVKPYETCAEMQIRLKLDEYARIIQRNYQTYRMRKYVKECAQIYRDILEKCKKYEEEKAIADK